MKKILFTLLLVALAGPCFGENYNPGKLLWHGAEGTETIFIVEVDGSIHLHDKVVAAIARQGDICRIFGHKWARTTPNIMYATNPPQYPNETRKCDICQKAQEEKQARPEWVDIEKD